MKCIVIMCCVVVVATAGPLDKYTDRYDNMDLDEILSNKRLLVAYVNCVLDKGKCTPEGKELKDNLQDAIETGCEKCTEKQEKGAFKVMSHIIKNEPELWHELVAKFDPQGIYRKKYQERAKSLGIDIPDNLN